MSKEMPSFSGCHLKEMVDEGAIVPSHWGASKNIP